MRASASSRSTTTTLLLLHRLVLLALLPLCSHPSAVAAAEAKTVKEANTASAFDCGNLRATGTQAWDLSPLGGPRSVLHSVDQGLSLHNTTYTIDLCKGLSRKKDVPKGHQCPSGTRVCAIERLLNKEEKTDTLEKVVPIAGELKDEGGDALDARWKVLQRPGSRKSPSQDKDVPGFTLEFHGGMFGSGAEKRTQMAEIAFLCDPERTGLEHLWTPEAEDEYVEKLRLRNVGTGTGLLSSHAMSRRATEDDDDATTEPNEPSLEFVAYDTGSGDVDVLRLKWRTKYACRSKRAESGRSKTGSWGFFTWFIVIAFMSTAAYLIFGSWLNYNRYGARGWDLLPHGDAIRDVPYLLRDWTRRVLSTVQGGDSRGGYAAV